MNATHSQKAINAYMILGDSSWQKDGDIYRLAKEALMKLSLKDLQTIKLVVRTSPPAEKSVSCQLIESK